MRRTLDLYACMTFSARQEKRENVASWGSHIDEMQTELREAARRICRPEEILGAVGLISHLRKACFVQGLNNERIQTIVRSTGKSILLLLAMETPLEEEGAILSIRETSGAGGNTIRRTICNRLSHMASKCVSKDRLPPANARTDMSFMSCFKCGRAGHLASPCRQKSNKGSCGPSGHVEECRPGTTSGVRKQGSSKEAAYDVQRKNWIRSGNERQGPMRNQSCPQTRRQ